MRMLVGRVRGCRNEVCTHRILIIGRGSERPEAGDIGLSLEEAKTLISAVESYERTK
jgi:hypothetical protein